MGSIYIWIHVASYGIFWAVCMWIWDIGEKPYPKLRRSLASFLLGGLAFGIWDSFGWHAFRAPLIFIVFPALALGIWLGRAARPDPPAESGAGTK
jgi:hypothetical protein